MGKVIIHNMKLQVSDIKDTIHDIKVLKDNIKVASEDIVRALVESGEQVANEVNASAPSSGTERSQVISAITEHGNAGYVALTGPGAVYDEFGTGEEGSAHSHPAKQFASRPLNPYNSGPTIKVNKQGTHYWRYPAMAGRPYFKKNGVTYGIPAGKQIFTASIHVRQIKNSVAQETLNESLQFFKKTE